MNLTEYFNQTEPQRTPMVILKESEYVLREVANFNNLYNKHGYKAVKIEEL